MSGFWIFIAILTSPIWLPLAFLAFWLIILSAWILWAGFFVTMLGIPIKVTRNGKIIGHYKRGKFTPNGDQS